MYKVSLKISDETLCVLVEDIFLKPEEVVLHFSKNESIYSIMSSALKFGFEFYKYADGHAALYCPISLVFNIKVLTNE